MNEKLPQAVIGLTVDDGWDFVFLIWADRQGKFEMKFDWANGPHPGTRL